MIAPSYQVTLEGETIGLEKYIDLFVIRHVCHGEYPDHIKGAAPDDTEGEFKGFYQFEAHEARECAVQSTVRAIEKAL